MRIQDLVDLRPLEQWVGRLGRKVPIRWAWRILGGLLAVLLLGMGTLQTVVQLAHTSETTREQFDATGITTVEVDNSAGSVHVVGTDSDTIRVTAELDHGLQETGHTEQVADGMLRVDTDCPALLSSFCQVDYRIEVPSGLTVSVRAEKEVTVRDVSGQLDLWSEIGSVEATRVGGSLVMHSQTASVTGRELRADVVDASSEVGDVVVDFVQPPRSVVARTDVGAVEVVLPVSSPPFQVNAQTDVGQVTQEVNTRVDAEPTVEATSDVGDVTIRYREG